MELLEGDHCPFSLNRRLSKHRRIRQGIEFYKRQKVAYWFYDVHPDDDLTDIKLAKLTRVPARDVIHHYRPDRPGQIRGVPDSAAALLKDRTFADYHRQRPMGPHAHGPVCPWALGPMSL